MDKIRRAERHLRQVERLVGRFQVALPDVPIDDIVQRVASQHEFIRQRGHIHTCELSAYKALRSIIEELAARSRAAQRTT